MARLRREARGSVRPPPLAIVGPRCVARLGEGARGHDAGQKVMGRKRVAIVDPDGTMPVPAVVPADVQGGDCLEVPARPAGRTGRAGGRDGNV